MKSLEASDFSLPGYFAISQPELMFSHDECSWNRTSVRESLGNTFVEYLDGI